MTEAQTSPAKPAPSIYDIGAFLAGGLNETPESMRERLVRLRERGAHLERDQEDYLAVEYDTVLDLIESAERLLDMWDDDTHILVVQSFVRGWSIEHPLRCRATNTMHACPYHRFMETLPHRGQWPIGRNRMVMSEDGNVVTFEGSEA